MKKFIVKWSEKIIKSAVVEAANVDQANDFVMSGRADSFRMLDSIYHVESTEEVKDEVAEYDSFRVCRVAEYADPHGGTNCEIVDEEHKDDEARQYFYTLYGCKRNGLEDALMDNEYESTLLVLCDLLNKKEGDKC